MPKGKLMNHTKYSTLPPLCRHQVTLYTLYSVLAPAHIKGNTLLENKDNPTT